MYVSLYLLRLSEESESCLVSSWTSLEHCHQITVHVRPHLLPIYLQSMVSLNDVIADLDNLWGCVAVM